MRNDGIDPAKVSDKIYYLEKGVYKLMIRQHTKRLQVLERL